MGNYHSKVESLDDSKICSLCQQHGVNMYIDIQCSICKERCKGYIHTKCHNDYTPNMLDNMLKNICTKCSVDV